MTLRAPVRYSRAQGAEKMLRENIPPATLKQYRTVIATYENIVRRYPTSASKHSSIAGVVMRAPETRPP